MYNPRVVSSFLTILENSPPVGVACTRRPRTGLADITGTAQGDMRRSQATRGDAEAFETLFDLGVQTATATSTEKRYRGSTEPQTLMPADICAVYLYARSTDSLVATSVSGPHAETIAGRRCRGDSV